MSKSKLDGFDFCCLSRKNFSFRTKEYLWRAARKRLCTGERATQEAVVTFHPCLAFTLVVFQTSSSLTFRSLHPVGYPYRKPLLALTILHPFTSDFFIFSSFFAYSVSDNEPPNGRPSSSSPTLSSSGTTFSLL